MGTPGFMAPEVMAGAPGGVPADVYGLGASLFFALTAATPEDCEPRARESAMVGGVPLELDDLIMRMLDRDPSRRPASLDEVVMALASVRRRGREAGRSIARSPCR